MRLVRSLALLVLVAVAATPAAAQNMRFISGHPYGTVSAFGVLVGPYRGQILSGGPGEGMIDMYCVDWFHDVWNGAEWTANFSSYSGSLGNTRMMTDFGLSSGAALHRYEMAAWLATQMTLDNKNQWGSIQGTIWNVMGANPPASYAGHSAPPSASTYWYNQAQNNYDNINLDEWTVISDAAGRRQEFITRNVVPEPGTLLLLGTGLFALGLMAYFRRTA